MTSPHIDVRPMRHEDIDEGLRLCRVSGWDQVARDWEMFVGGESSTAVIAVQDGRALATAATIRYGASFGWIGMVLVDPAAQGRGLGGSMLKQAMEQIRDLPSIRLDATPAGRSLYLKSGFLEEYHLRRMEAARAVVTDSSAPRVRPMTPGDLPAVCAVDRVAFGAPRTQLIEWMFHGAPEYAQIARVNQRVTGYVLGRRGHDFDHVGPLVADDVQTARTLATACLSQQSSRGFVIDATLHSAEWSRFLEDAGFREQRPYIRMYHGGAPPFGQPQRQFAVLGPEFG